MPPSGGTRTSLVDVATAVTRRPPIATYTWGGAGRGFDVTQFKDTFVPGSTFSPGYRLRPEAGLGHLASGTAQTPN